MSNLGSPKSSSSVSESMASASSRSAGSSSDVGSTSTSTSAGSSYVSSAGSAGSGSGSGSSGGSGDGGPHCYHKRVVTYDCPSDTWGEPADSHACGNTFGLPIGWNKVGETETTCTYAYVRRGVGCDQVGNCADFPPEMPAHPAFPFDCPCLPPSSSSSSSPASSSGGIGPCECPSAGMTFLLQFRLHLKRPGFECIIYVDVELTHAGGEECIWNITPTVVDCDGVGVNIFGSVKLDGGDTWLLNLNSGVFQPAGGFNTTKQCGLMTGSYPDIVYDPGGGLYNEFSDITIS